MARGGARPGAGRKAGEVTRKTREIAEGALAQGITPLEYMLERLRDDKEADEIRRDMAKAAAPYIHPRLASIEANINAHITIGSALDALD